MAGTLGRLFAMTVLSGSAMVLAPAAHAQNATPPATPAAPSAADEIERLRGENEDLKRKIAALERELTSARTSLAALRAKTKEGGKPGPTKIELPTDPLACPDSMLADLKKKYQSEFGSLQDPKDDASLRLKAQRWARDAEKQARGKTVWAIKFQRIDQIGQGANATARATAQVIDATTQLPIGDPFPMDIPARFSTKVTSGGPDAVWQLGLVVAPKVKFNPQRPEAGKPDVPPFVGKYIELEPEYQWETLVESKK